MAETAFLSGARSVLLSESLGMFVNHHGLVVDVSAVLRYRKNPMPESVFDKYSLRRLVQLCSEGPET
jgi:hypothetical protein